MFSSFVPRLESNCNLTIAIKFGFNNYIYRLLDQAFTTKSKAIAFDKDTTLFPLYVHRYESQIHNTHCQLSMRTIVLPI